jgi:hypothetical protein
MQNYKVHVHNFFGYQIIVMILKNRLSGTLGVLRAEKGNKWALALDPTC